MNKGLIQIYTGDGKGKTTAAIGLDCRAIQNNLKVGYISFHKDPDKWNYGELKTLSGSAKNTLQFTAGMNWHKYK